MTGQVLKRVESPQDLRELGTAELRQLAAEIRSKIIATVARTGGHLASNLGVVELTLALHRVYESPRDQLIWDTSNQTYAHKLVTGRAEQFDTLRQSGGISGFAAREESVHDILGAGHAGTGVSAGVGMALAARLQSNTTAVATVIGDGAFTAGVVYEALNQAGDLQLPFVLVLNDNGMSISPNVGAVGHTLGQKRNYRWSPPDMGGVPDGPVCPVDGDARSFFAAFGFAYVGPVDGHDMEALEAALQQAKDQRRPVVVHVFTHKGRGLEAAETDPIRMHQPGTAQAVQGAQKPSYSQVLAETLTELARSDTRLVAISAAMLEGTALTGMQEALPGRVFDVGICEGHAVALAAGLATQGLRPVVCIYSTFLQRAFDQIVHDVAIQGLPVVLGVDRAGLVGDDGRTHHGVLDLAYLRAIPNLVVAAPKDENELRHLLATGLESERPFAIRYSRGAGLGVPLTGPPQILPLGRGELLREGCDVALLALGWGVPAAQAAATQLAQQGVQAAVVNARYVKPLDHELLLGVAAHTRRVVTIEDHNAMGGFGSAVLELLADAGLSDVAVRRLALPDTFQEHGPVELLRAANGLTPEGIAAAAQKLCASALGVLDCPDPLTIKA